jgi:hypothetical protein
MVDDILGAGQYEVYFKTYGGYEFLCRAFNLTSVTWNRRLNETSEATVNFALNGLQGSCCGCVSQVNPWQHEISIYRDGEEVWCGPVTGGEIDQDNNTAMFTGKDLSAWFDKRWIEPVDTDVEFEEADIVDVYNWLMGHAYFKDPWNMQWAFTDRLGIPMDRTYIAYDPDNERWGGLFPMAGDEMRELRKSGVDFTVIRRSYLAGDLIDSRNTVARLLDGHFRSQPKIIIVGTGMATEVGVGGGAGGYSGWDDDQMWIERPNDEARQQFGLLQYFESAPDLDETDTYELPNPITQRAYGLRELKKRPFEYITGGLLAPNAPITFNQLIPGRYVQIDLLQTCRPILSSYMMTEVSVSFDENGEEVRVEIVPPGVEALRG